VASGKGPLNSTGKISSVLSSLTPFPPSFSFPHLLPPLPCSFHVSLISTFSSPTLEEILNIASFDPRQRQRIFPLDSATRPALEAHPACYLMAAGGPIPSGKARSGRDADHSSHLVSRSRMSRSYTSSPPWSLHGDSGTALLYYFYCEKLREVKIDNKLRINIYVI
jgi:hypothetical protein